METPSPVDLAADRDLLPEIYRLRAECHRLDAPEEPFATEQVWRGVVLHPAALVTRLHWAVEGGYAGLSWIRGGAGASVEVCVAPSRRRRGLGRALLETVTVYARTLGCARLVGRHTGASGAAFAAAVGARTPGPATRSRTHRTRRGPTSPGGPSRRCATSRRRWCCGTAGSASRSPW